MPKNAYFLKNTKIAAFSKKTKISVGLRRRGLCPSPRVVTVTYGTDIYVDLSKCVSGIKTILLL